MLFTCAIRPRTCRGGGTRRAGWSRRRRRGDAGGVEKASRMLAYKAVALARDSLRWLWTRYTLGTLGRRTTGA